MFKINNNLEESQQMKRAKTQMFYNICKRSTRTSVQQWIGQCCV